MPSTPIPSASAGGARRAVDQNAERIRRLERDRVRYEHYVARHEKLDKFRRKYLRWSIYGVGAICDDQRYLRSLKRIWLPLYDVLAIIAGIRSIYVGIPAIQEVLPDWASDLMCVALVVIATLCLVGVLTPRLYKLEIWAKSGLLGVFGGNIIALRILVAEGDAARDFVSITVAMAMIPPLFRLGILAQEKRDREDAN